MYPESFQSPKDNNTQTQANSGTFQHPQAYTTQTQMNTGQFQQSGFGDLYPYSHIPPPPPPNKNRHGILWAIIVTLLVISIVSLSFVGVQLYGHTSSKAKVTIPTTLSTQSTKATQPTIQPTMQPSVTPTDTHIVNAVDIYNDIASKLSTSTHSIVASGYDNSWSGWPYAPARQAFVWYDNNVLFEIAAFNTVNASSIDTQYSNSINQSKYWAMQIGTCMFLYDSQRGTILSGDYILFLGNEPGCK